ncbi:hypothetical protein [Paenibacillus ginsengarvi]|nr:hypothetical protein [Paenibacillus ginsengarvi]
MEAGHASLALNPRMAGYLQRSIGNRAVGALLHNGSFGNGAARTTPAIQNEHALPESGSVIRRDMLKYDQIPDPKTHKRWSPFRTPKGVGRETDVEGAGAKWTTNVTWKAADHDDGVEMIADPLGPDHPLGSQPGKDGVWNDKRKKQEERAGNNTEYVAGHLLNDNLGGPGNDARNLAAIPKVANSQHSSKVEDKIKSIVNDHHGWVYYKVWTDQVQDTAARYKPYYTSALHCEWHQLDPVNKTPIAGTDGKVDIAIPPPSYYNTGNTGLQSDPVLNGAGVNKSDKGAGAAWSRLSRKEVVLTNSDDLSSAAAVMKPIQTVLDQMGVSEYLLDVDHGALKKSLSSITLATALSTDEKKANDIVKRELKVLEDLHTKSKLADYPLPDELRWALEKAPQERKKRFDTVMNATGDLYKMIYEATAAADLMSDVQKAFDQEEEPRQNVEKMCVRLIEVAVELKRQRDEAMKSSLSLANPFMSMHGLPGIDTSQPFPDQLKAVQELEPLNVQDMDEVEMMYAPMSPYRTEMAEEETTKEYPGFIPRGSRTVQQQLRSNQTKLKSSKFLSGMKKHGQPYSSQQAHQYDRKLIDLIRRHKSPNDLLVPITVLRLTIGHEVPQLLLDYVNARSSNDEDAQEDAKQKIRDSYAGNGLKYQKAFAELSRQ